MRTLFNLLVLAWLMPWLATAQPSDTVFTVILEGGTVYDGLGTEPIVADVGVLDDRITTIGDLSDRRAGLRLDVAGLAVVPGFIDIHSHADRGILERPLAENYVRQGVTTVVGGPDGSSAYPVGEFLARLDVTPPAINFGTMVGHNTIRRRVMGNENRTPTPDELAAMQDSVKHAMRDGAFGLSTGLKYVPGAYAETEEVIALAREAAQYGGFHKSHMRDEGLDVLASVEETIRIGEEGHLPTQLTHHKVIGKFMWGQSTETLRMVDAARARGVDVSIDQYPYIASSTGLTILFPAWSLEGNQDDLVARLQDAEARAKIKDAIIFNLERDRGGGDPANVAVAYCAWDTTLNGLNLAQILEQRGQLVTVERAAELAMDLQEQGGFQGIFFAMSEDDVERIMQHPMTMIASDGGIPMMDRGVPHPRNYGTFARVLGRYVREQGVLSFAEALRKMTSLPAQRLGLSERGVVRVGAFADIAVLDPETIIDHATFAEPHQYATGVQYVFVNGRAALLEGAMTGVRAGRALRKSQPTDH
ncbi:MAG TPA: D-aminoacylase [Rhodothermales bacterium]|nr:D-aminoacylase [Rhodothermales bacterium]